MSEVNAIASSVHSGLAFFGFLTVAALAELSGTVHDGRWVVLIASIALIASFRQSFAGAAYTGLLAALFLNFFFSQHYGRLSFDSSDSATELVRLMALALVSSAAGHLRLPAYRRVRPHGARPISSRQLGSMAASLDAERQMRASRSNTLEASSTQDQALPSASSRKTLQRHG